MRDLRVPGETSQETEVKILVRDLSTIAAKLQELGATITHPRVYERNMRYDDDNGRLTQNNIVLRLREDSRVRLTYKEPAVIERGITRREELEVEVADFDAMEKILAKFGYVPSMCYEKYRTTYELGHAEIVLDELPYGNFIEVEADDIEQIEQILSALQLADAERLTASYTKLFDFVKHHLELEFVDLTFENFAAIDVPESAFIAPGSVVIR